MKAEVMKMVAYAFEDGKKAGREEVVEWIKEHQLIAPNESSITRFEPFYQIEEIELKEWGL